LDSDDVSLLSLKKIGVSNQEDGLPERQRKNANAEAKNKQQNDLE